MSLLQLLSLALTLYKELGVRLSRSITATRQLRAYLEEACSDPDLLFHRKDSTLPIPCKASMVLTIAMSEPLFWNNCG